MESSGAFFHKRLAALGIDTITDVAAADAMGHFRWPHNLQSVRPIKKVFVPLARWITVKTLSSRIPFAPFVPHCT